MGSFLQNNVPVSTSHRQGDGFRLVNKKFDLVDQKFDIVHGRLDRLESLAKTMIGWQIASLTLIAGTLTGLVGVLAVRLW